MLSVVKNWLKVNRFPFSLALLIRNFLIPVFLKKPKNRLNDSDREILKRLKKDGIVIIPDYFSEEECKTMIAEFDKYVDNHSVYCEENERRLFGMEVLSKPVKDIFSDDMRAWKICEEYLGEEMSLQSTMMAKITFKNGVKYGSGGSWHRDSYAKQIKSISYLTDMTDENGPFMYIKGSHKMSRILKLIFSLDKEGGAGNYRFSDYEIDRAQSILKEGITYFPCSKGTLVLADIRGLHTTRYVKKGMAYSLFNYYVSKIDDRSDSGIKSLAKECIKGVKRD